MILTILIGLMYIAIFIAGIIGIIYFIGKRQQEKRDEKEILERDDY